MVGLAAATLSLGRVRARLWVVLLAVALLAGCGAGGDDDETAASTTEATEADAETSSTTEEEASTSSTTSTTETDASTTETTGDAPGAGTPFCTIYGELNEFDTRLNEAGGPEDVESIFAEALELGDQLVEAAPADLQADASAVNGALRQVDDLLRRYGYDFARIDAEAGEEELAVLDNPEVSASSDRIEAYATEECGITP